VSVLTKAKRSWATSLRPNRNEDGTFLVEMIVSIFLLAIALGMTIVIVGVLTKSVANTTNTGTSADVAQSTLLSLSSYVNGAVSPTSGAVADLQPSQVTSLCWGSNAVSTQQNSDSDGWSPTYNATQLNETVGVIYAHDFAMEFCGYGPDGAGSGSDGSLPNVYEIFVNVAAGCTANNYCPLDIENLTPFNSATQTQTAYSSTTDYPTADVPPSSPPAGTIIGSIGRVWCDQACRQLGISCQSINLAYTNYTSAGMTPPPLPAGYNTLCPAGYSGTPPLFNYYTNAGVGNLASPNPSLNWTNAFTNSSTIPPNVVTSTSVTSPCVTNATTFVAASCGPLDMYSPVDAQTLENIQCVVLNMTVLGQDNPSAATSKSSSVNITGQVWLRDLAG
jgi:hypothetical protein